VATTSIGTAETVFCDWIGNLKSKIGGPTPCDKKCCSDVVQNTRPSSHMWKVWTWDKPSYLGTQAHMWNAFYAWAWVH